MTTKIKVFITSGYRWSYFQWFLLGLYELQNDKQISLTFKLPIWSYLLSKLSNKFMLRIVDKCRRIFEADSYNMDGYIEFIINGKQIRKKFTIDCADSPFLYDNSKLKSYDVYFKMQCPKEFNSAGFKLTDEVIIPWCDHEHLSSKQKLTERGERKQIKQLDISKIKPLLSATRSLGNGISYKVLKNGYSNYLKDRKIKKNKKIMCYFGNALGPIATKPEYSEKPDYDCEADLMYVFNQKISHPNEKRAIVAKLIALVKNSDSRIISSIYSDKNEKYITNKQIPLNEFCNHISQFEYNANVSGFRMSIPSRFIESIMVGTSILTDKLRVKWFRPFDKEVIETVEMGYLPIDRVDWNAFQKDLNDLKVPNSKDIVNLFENKWSPQKVAEYIVDTVINS